MPPAPEQDRGSEERPFTEDTFRQTASERYPAQHQYCRCISCGSTQQWLEMHNWDCNTCHEGTIENQDDDEEGYFEEKKWSSDNLPAFQSRGRGKYIKSGRIFSAEIECYYPNSRALRCLNELPDGIGVASDGSLNECGIELQTPKLKGAQGEKQLTNLCNTLRKNGYTVDRTTGLHIHLDGRGLLPRTRGTEPVALKQLWYFYHTFDDVLLSFLPVSRRNNHYCKPTKHSATASQIQAISSLRQAEELWYATRGEYNLRYAKDHHYHNSRYGGLNLHSLFSEKHAEIRFHGGTLNSVKILEWVNLHQTILDLAAKKELYIEVLSQIDSTYTLAQQTAVFFSILDLPKRTEKYFLQRQKTFASSQRSEGQELENIGIISTIEQLA